ncbi:MAG: hypothetical protein JEZ07_13305 [Phycisphaerae bacterium]|nr:hypothetical protein [Phycisphaerae bacterium]
MIPDDKLANNGMLIITGASLKAETFDRPLAYKLKDTILGITGDPGLNEQIVVMSDMWYLSSEALHDLPVVSIGEPGNNALSAYFFKRLANALVVDDVLRIQMDVELHDLRVALWGCCHENTVEAIELFVHNGYLEKFLDSVFD